VTYSWREHADAVDEYRAAVYIMLEGEVVVVAYAHERRLPGYWSRRLAG
jgi:hypothetical protein